MRNIPKPKNGRNPAKIEVGSLSHYLHGLGYIPGGFLAGILNHQGRASSLQDVDVVSKSPSQATGAHVDGTPVSVPTCHGTTRVPRKLQAIKKASKV